MREESLEPLNYSNNTRITPAHAGRIGYRRSAREHAQDHPRACGKNVKYLGGLISASGSPPRMREE